MKLSNKSFYLVFLTLFLGSSLILFLLERAGSEVVHPKYWAIQLFFFFVTLLSHFFSVMGLKKKSEFYVFYMASMVIRFIFSLFFIFISLYFLKDGHIPFVIDFLVLYLLYSAFEIYFLLRNLRAD